MERFSTVIADDGTALAVRETGPVSAPLTLVFCHGFCLHSGVWARQRSGLTEQLGGQVRMVFYDHRGHGRSGSGPAGADTIDQLGADLAAVIRTVVPTGPVVLIGHSMGGMAVLAYVARQPEVVGDRVVGIALVSTAAGSVAHAGIGRLLRTPLPWILRACTNLAPGAVQAGWDWSRRLLAPVIGVTLPAAPVSKSTEVGYRMLHRTAIQTISAYLAAIKRYDAAVALPTLAELPMVVVCGSRDVVTPLRHSQRIAGAVLSAELVTVVGARHMLIIDHHDIVTASVRRLIDRIRVTTPAA